MKKIILTISLCSALFYFNACDDCEVNPDLISDLLVPSADLIQGEPIDWDYIIQSIDDNIDCDIIDALASIGQIVVDYFENANDNTPEEILNIQNNIGNLGSGEQQVITNTFTFDSMGIYMVNVSADVTDVVAERDEDNNNDTGEKELRMGLDLFKNASPNFKDKLNKSAAIVIVGEFTDGLRPTHYRGKPIYYSTPTKVSEEAKQF